MLTETVIMEARKRGMFGTATGVIDYAGEISRDEEVELRAIEREAMCGNVGCYLVPDVTSQVIEKYRFDDEVI